MKTSRKLQEYYRFKIDFTKNGIRFFSTSGQEKNYNFKLTAGQWKRAKKYITRKLIPFTGYIYSPIDSDFRGIKTIT